MWLDLIIYWVIVTIVLFYLKKNKSPGWVFIRIVDSIGILYIDDKYYWNRILNLAKIWIPSIVTLFWIPFFAFVYPSLSIVRKFDTVCAS